MVPTLKKKKTSTRYNRHMPILFLKD